MTHVPPARARGAHRSEEHTSELQSPCNLVCRLLLEKKNLTDRRLDFRRPANAPGRCVARLSSRTRRTDSSICFFFNDTATTEIYTLSLHDALPISSPRSRCAMKRRRCSSVPHLMMVPPHSSRRSEEHTSELQSPCNLVCRLLL